MDAVINSIRIRMIRLLHLGIRICTIVLPSTFVLLLRLLNAFIIRYPHVR